MKLQFFGAAGTVTGSKTLITNEVGSYLIDAGLYQGEDWLTQKNSEPFKFDFIDQLKGIFITHAHLDHCGYLPYLVAQGFSGPIFMTEATMELVKIVLEDAFSILENDLKQKKIESMPYSEDDLAKVTSMFVVKKKGELNKHESISFKFIEAGHILGASSLWIEWKHKKLLFSGDLGRVDDLVHTAPEICTDPVDSIIIEGTYGGRTHTSDLISPQLNEAIDYIKQREGVLLIPCFAIARSAIVLKALKDYFQQFPQQKVKIFVDSPMMIKALKTYVKFADQLKTSVKELEEILDDVKMIEFPKDRKKLMKYTPPYILLTSSGMLSGGRSTEHFARLAIKDFNYVIFVGYQGVGTLGRKVVDGERSFMADGKDRQIKAKIGQLKQLSAHADENEMIGYLKKIKLNQGRVYINHADPASAKLFYERITSDLGAEVVVAVESKSYEI